MDWNLCPEQLFKCRCLSISTSKKTWTKARVVRLHVGKCMNVLNLIICEHFLKINFSDWCLPWSVGGWLFCCLYLGFVSEVWGSSKQVALISSGKTTLSFSYLRSILKVKHKQLKHKYHHYMEFLHHLGSCPHSSCSSLRSFSQEQTPQATAVYLDTGTLFTNI